MQWHTLPVEAYGMNHTALHGRLPRMLRSSGNIQLYTPSILELTALLRRPYNTRLIRRAHMQASRPSVQQAVHDRDDEYGPSASQARGGEINTPHPHLRLGCVSRAQLALYRNRAPKKELDSSVWRSRYMRLSLRTSPTIVSSAGAEDVLRSSGSIIARPSLPA